MGESCAGCAEDYLSLFRPLFRKQISLKRPTRLYLIGQRLKGRIVITHDHRTMRPCAEDRLKAGRPMAGLILVAQTSPLGQVIDDLVLIAEATTADEWNGTIIFVPF